MSQNIKKIYFLLAGLIILALFIAVRQGKLPGTAADSGAMTSNIQPLTAKTDNQANVSVEVTPTVLKIGERPQFQVSFNTHSVNLDFAVDQIAKLTDQNNQTIGTASWQGAPPGGHHRSGQLVFDTVLPSRTQAVTLTLQGVAEVTRTFTWSIPQP